MNPGTFQVLTRFSSISVGLSSNGLTFDVRRKASATSGFQPIRNGNNPTKHSSTNHCKTPNAPNSASGRNAPAFSPSAWMASASGMKSSASSFSEFLSKAQAVLWALLRPCLKPRGIRSLQKTWKYRPGSACCNLLLRLRVFRALRLWR